MPNLSQTPAVEEEPELRITLGQEDPRWEVPVGELPGVSPAVVNPLYEALFGPAVAARMFPAVDVEGDPASQIIQGSQFITTDATADIEVQTGHLRNITLPANPRREIADFLRSMQQPVSLFDEDGSRIDHPAPHPIYGTTTGRHIVTHHKPEETAEPCGLLFESVCPHCGTRACRTNHEEPELSSILSRLPVEVGVLNNSVVRGDGSGRLSRRQEQQMWRSLAESGTL